MANLSEAHDGSQSEKCFLRMKNMFGNMVFILHACCAVVSVFELSFCMRCACQVKVGFVANSFSQDENREALTITRRFGFLSVAFTLL